MKPPIEFRPARPSQQVKQKPEVGSSNLPFNHVANADGGIVKKRDASRVKHSHRAVGGTEVAVAQRDRVPAHKKVDFKALKKRLSGILPKDEQDQFNAILDRYERERDDTAARVRRYRAKKAGK